MILFHQARSVVRLLQLAEMLVLKVFQVINKDIYSVKQYMIYSFNIKTDNGEKQFYLTADNHQKLYRRILSTYGVTKDQVEIIEEFVEDGYSYKLVKSYVTDQIDKNLLKEANSLYKNASRRCEPYKTEYFNKYKYSEIINVETVKDIAKLLETYKKVKVYWELGEKRGQHNYYAFVK